jgi:hypothetical protein
MPGKRKNLYLYLTLACFLGIIIIFILDGYMGLYDTVTATAGEIPFTYSFEQWRDQEKHNFTPSVSIGYGQQGAFSYLIENRRFSSYSAEIEVSLWHNQEKIADIYTDSVSIKPFSKAEMTWTLESSQYLPEGLDANTSAEFTLVIKNGDTERKMLVYVFTNVNQPGIKVIP